ncbi:MAG: glycosyltransferase family 4 protein [Methanocellales archaeon]|nr:glycosyltransferase family 4 protein [Methanocellales archaeon]
MKICRIVDKFPSKNEIIGDLEPNYYYLSKFAVEKGYDVHVVCGRMENQYEYGEIDGIRVHRICGIRNLRSILYGEFAKKCVEKVREIDPDIVHGHQVFHIGCIRNKKKLNMPIITHLHHMIDMYKHMDYLPISYDPKTAIYDRLIARYYFIQNKYLLKNSDYIIAVSKASTDLMKKYLPDKKIRVIYNGVDPEVFHHVDSDVKEQLDAKYLILFVGRPVPWKGIQYLLEATKKLNKEFKGLKILLLGVDRPDSQIYLRWLKDLSKKHGLDNVVYSKPVPYAEMLKYYSAADCFVLPSYPDPSPKVIYEALACGTPIVATNGGGIPELVTPEHGLLFEPRNVADLTNKIDNVLKHKGKFGKVKVHSWEESAESVVNLYDEIFRS